MTCSFDLDVAVCLESILPSLGLRHLDLFEFEQLIQLAVITSSRPR